MRLTHVSTSVDVSALACSPAGEEVLNDATDENEGLVYLPKAPTSRIQSATLRTAAEKIPTSNGFTFQLF